MDIRCINAFLGCSSLGYTHRIGMLVRDIYFKLMGSECKRFSRIFFLRNYLFNLLLGFSEWEKFCITLRAFTLGIFNLTFTTFITMLLFTYIHIPFSN